MIKRQREIETLAKRLKQQPVVGIVGARQVGKTTLARSFIRTMARPVSYFDLENPEDLARLADPMLALKDLKGLVVVDEVQRVPELFQVLSCAKLFGEAIMRISGEKSVSSLFDDLPV